MSERLTRSDWIDHGLRTLADDGAGSLKVGAMATALKVSRGSFYWHFRDLADFRTQLLLSWQKRTTDQVIREIDTEAEPDRLKALLERAFDTKRRSHRAATSREWSAERAIRSWAMADEAVAAMVASVDASRVAYIAQLLVAADVEARPALSRATFLYWAYLGQALVLDPRHASIAAPGLAEIGDLFES